MCAPGLRLATVNSVARLSSWPTPVSLIALPVPAPQLILYRSGSSIPSQLCHKLLQEKKKKKIKCIVILHLNDRLSLRSLNYDSNFSGFEQPDNPGNTNSTCKSWNWNWSSFKLTSRSLLTCLLVGRYSDMKYSQKHFKAKEIYFVL